MRQAASKELIALVASQMANKPWIADRAREKFLSPFAPRRRQRSPDKQKSYERRHRLAYSGIMPPWLAERFTTGQLAVMRIVADEQRQKGYCDLTLAAIATRAGVCRKTAYRAMHTAGPWGERLISIQERPRRGMRSLPNVVRIISSEWLDWLKKRYTRPRHTGGHLCPPTDNRCIKQPPKKCFDGQREGYQEGQYRTGPPRDTRRRSYG